MSTIGHPLSDISNFLTPYFTAKLDPARAVNVHPGFLPRATRGLPTPDEITSLYFSIADAPARNPSSSLELTLSQHSARADPRDRARELQWAQAFNIFRLSAVCQGIAARVAARQATSEQARRYGDGRASLADFAWELVQGVKAAGAGARGQGKPKL